MPERKVINIPSKTFLIGEYGVLSGGPMLVLNHAPFFKADFESKIKSQFHPMSPAGEYLKDKATNFEFIDPYAGGGGFGGSTAELIAAFKSFDSEPKNLHKLFDLYLEIYEDQNAKPSGADLYTQFEERVALYKFENKTKPGKVEIKWPFKDTDILIYKTKIKVKTHEHLESLQKIDFDKLNSISEKVLESIENKNFLDFKKNINLFSNKQKELNLLHNISEKIVSHLHKIEGVEIARGCGALGADVVAIFVKSQMTDYIKSKISTDFVELDFINKVDF